MGHAPANPADVVELDGLPHAGEVIAGKYQVEKVIGAGGMGVVVVARHLLLNQPVAVKFLHPQAAVRTDPKMRFLREARAAAALRSEHVARVLDVGELPSGDPYMVMEYLDGSPLSRVIRTRAPLPIEEAINYMLQACEAIGEAHSIGIVHRDLKPGNMFITKRPNGSPLLKVLDFGIAKAVGGDSAVEEQTLTATNMIMGSPQYASPEQLRSSKNVDRRTDIWALGVILYYMLTGRRPFEADSMAALCMDIATKSPAPIASLRPNVPQALEEVILRCLKKDRDDRMPDVSTLVSALQPFAGVSGPMPAQLLPSGSMPIGLLGPGDVPSQPSTMLSNATTEPHAATLMTRSAWSAAPQPRRRPPMVAIQATAVAVAAVIAMAAIYLGKRSSSQVEGQHVDAVTPAQTTTAAPKPVETTPPPVVTGSSEIITSDSQFAAPPTGPQGPATATATGGREPPPSSAPLNLAPGSFVVAKGKFLLRDSSNGVVGNVPKGGSMRVVRTSGEWVLVILEGEGLSTGWAPMSMLVAP